MNLVTPLNRVLGLGSAKGGVEHWWAQRLSAAALVLLGLWLALALAGLDDFSYGTVVPWIGQPLPAVLLILTVLTAAHHSHLGVRVVLEDYVHGRAAKTVVLALSAFAHALVALASLFAILKVAFTAP